MMTITGWGVAVPPGVATQEEAAQHAVEMWGHVIGRGPAVLGLYRRSGVKTRHSVLVARHADDDHAEQKFYHRASCSNDRGPSTLIRMQRYEREATELATQAGQKAIESAAISPESITHLVTTSCSGFASPGFDLGLIDTLGLRRNVVRTHIGFMGCHAAFNAWRVADAFAGAGPTARVLVCCVELCSLHQQYSADADQIVANSLFADGAAALIAQSHLSEQSQPNRDSHLQWSLICQQSFVVPESADFMTWRIGDHGFQMTLSPQIPDLIQTHLKGWLAEWLLTQRIRLDDIKSWAIHPGGPRILNACEAALQLAPEALAASRAILERYGNMSSPTVIFILNRLREQSAPRPCVSLAFGPGITLEAAVWR